jgi:hypothetical protein
MGRDNWVVSEGRVNQVYKEGGKQVVLFAYIAGEHVYAGTFTPFVKTFAVGDKIEVRYDPDDPNRNDVVESHKNKGWLRLAITVLVTVGVLAILLVQWLLS